MCVTFTPFNTPNLAHNQDQRSEILEVKLSLTAHGIALISHVFGR